MGDEQTLPRSGTSDERRSVDSNPAAFEDTIHGALAESTRRTALGYLAEHPGPTTVEQLAAELAASERGLTVDAVTDEQQVSTLVTLNHVHLPRLDEAGLIEWDRHTDYVSATPLLTQLSTTTPMAGGSFEPSSRSNLNQ